MSDARTIVIAGASGLLGQGLVPHLQARGFAVVRLVRRPPERAGELAWNPETGDVELARIRNLAAVVNLAGANIAGGRWTEARQVAIRESRLRTTRTLVETIGRMADKPAVLVNASAIGFYGDRGDDVLTEAVGPGSGFLADVVGAWEAEASRCFVREVRLRFGVILGHGGGALAKMIPVFRLGLGGPLGHGRQWLGWIALDDAVAAVAQAVTDERWRGPINVVAPEQVTNARFAAELGRALGRPAFCRVPAWVLRGLFGEMARETLLASARVEPALLKALGFGYRFPGLPEALRQAVRRP